MDVLILAGGLGTRLRSVVEGPKPLAEIAGRPFVEYIIRALVGCGLDRIVCCVGHGASEIEQQLGSGEALGAAIRYSRELTPLGTGGAVRHALPLVNGERMLVLNGDSFLDADPRALIEWHVARGAQASLALTTVDAGGRFGAVDVTDDGLIVGFREKAPGIDASGRVTINAGVYVLERSSVLQLPAGAPSSLERDLFPALVGAGLYGMSADAWFIDIGVPADYRSLIQDPAPLLGARLLTGAH